jgi:hypothetical protein
LPSPRSQKGGKNPEKLSTYKILISPSVNMMAAKNLGVN